MLDADERAQAEAVRDGQDTTSVSALIVAGWCCELDDLLQAAAPYGAAAFEALNRVHREMHGLELVACGNKSTIACAVSFAAGRVQGAMELLRQMLRYVCEAPIGVDGEPASTPQEVPHG